MDVHAPYDTFWYPLFDSKAYLTEDEKGRLINTYDGRIVYTDKQIKRIHDALLELGLSDRTLLIITADHGEELYDHDGIGHCTTLYDELIKVPLIIIGLSPSRKGTSIESQVELIDLFPTILDFLGLPVPEQMKGRSLFSLPAEATRKKKYALSYTTRGRRSLKTKEGRLLWKKRVWDQGIVLSSLRVGNEWKMIVGDDGRTELYDLKKDKGEQRNLEGVEKSMVDTLSRKLREITSRLKSLNPGKEKLNLSPATKNRLKALGYL